MNNYISIWHCCFHPAVFNRINLLRKQNGYLYEKYLDGYCRLYRDFTILFVSIIVYGVLCDKEDALYAKYNNNHIRIHTEQDEQMDKVIELLDEIKKNTNIVGRSGK